MHQKTKDFSVTFFSVQVGCIEENVLVGDKLCFTKNKKAAV